MEIDTAEERNKKKNNRLKHLDIARGICIFFVVLGHAIIPSIRNNNKILEYIYKYIYSFHMPVFFIISGIIFENNVYKYDSKLQFFKKKAKLLLVPYLTFSVITYIGVEICLRLNGIKEILLGMGDQSSNFVNAIISIFFYNNHIDKHLWFVYLLFLIFSINIITSKSKKKSLIISIVIVLTTYFFNLTKYWDILKYSSFFVFFSLGRFYDKYKFIELHFKHIIFTFIVFNLFTFINIMCNIGGLVEKVFVILIGCLGTITILEISKYIQKNKYGICNILNILYKYSYDIYLIHQPFIVSGLMGVLVKINVFPISLNLLIVTSVGMILPIMISKYILRRNKWLMKLCLGK